MFSPVPVTTVRHQKHETLKRTQGKIALVASLRIYLTRNSPDWSSGKFVTPSELFKLDGIIL